jgi:hypothetical protein
VYPSDELAALQVRFEKLERDLRTVQGELEVAESAARVAKHARAELSIEVARLRRAVRDLALLVAPLGLLLKQLQANPVNEEAWKEARETAAKITVALLEMISPSVESDPLPESASQPYPRAPSAVPPKR